MYLLSCITFTHFYKILDYYSTSAVLLKQKAFRFGNSLSGIMQGGVRFNSIGSELRKQFGRRTVKLSIDAGFTCPNRDGTCGYGGCAFCSGGGSGELASHIEADSLSLRQSVSESISEQITLLSDKWPDAAYIAYFQSHTNTYAPVQVLRSLYYEALNDPRVSGIAIATRPDCLGPDVLDLLEEISHDHFMWVELGLQTIHPDTSEAMGIGYTLDVYDQAVNDLEPRLAVDAAKAAVQRDRASGQTGDEGVAFAGGDAEIPGKYGPDHDRQQSRGQGNDGVVGVCTEIDHIGNRLRHRRIDRAHNENAKKIENRGNKYSRPCFHASCGDAGCDRIGAVRPAIDENNPKGQTYRKHQEGIRYDLIPKKRKR